MAGSSKKVIYAALIGNVVIVTTKFVAAGGGTYDELVQHTIEVTVFGTPCRCLDLPHLIYVKRAAGRPKDLEAVAELEALLEERGAG